MHGYSSPVSRRNVLGATGGALAVVGAANAGSAEPDGVEVNVGYGADSGRSAALSQAETVVREFQSLDVLTLRLPEPAAEALSGRGDVRYVEENGTYRALAQAVPWGVERVDAETTHSYGETGSDADVAIVDTGIDSDHPDLAANLGDGDSFVSCETRGGCRFGRKPADNACHRDWDDDNAHGTHCAGVAAATDDDGGVVGVAPDATLHAVKVLDKCGSGSWSDVAAGIEYVADQGWDVASMSLGGTADSSAVSDAVEYAADNGVFLAGAAGNEGPCTDCVGYPAAYDEVVAVSATTSDDDLSVFSSTGPEIELAAPGSDVSSTVPGGYATFSGTSMACPHVAGSAALLAAKGYTRAEIRSSLTSAAEDVGLPNDEQGEGLLDVAASLEPES